MNNLNLAVILGVCNGARFGLGVWILYYLRYTDYAGIGIIEGVMIALVFLLEIPSGAVADILGKRKALILAYGFFTSGFVALTLTSNFLSLLIAVILFTIGLALNSGSFEAMLFESLQKLNRDQEYGHWLAKIRGYRLVMIAISCGLGGYLYTLNPKLPYALSAVSFGVGLLTTFFLKETGSRQPLLKPLAFVKQNLRGLQEVRRVVRLDSLLVMFLLGGFLIKICDEILDDALAVAFGFSPTQLGWLFTIIYLAGSGASFLSAKIKGEPSVWKITWLMYLICALTLLISPKLGLWLGGLSVLIRYAARVVVENVESERMNHQIKQDLRATTLSAYAMVKGTPYMLCAFGIGSLLDQTGAKIPASWLGLIFLVLTLSYLFKVRKFKT